MSQEDEYGDEHSPDHWFSRFENECLGEVEDQSRMESSRVQAVEEHSAQQSWLGFQQTSTAIAQLYNMKEAGYDGHLVLVPFNKAAESLTKFYKDSVNNSRECLRAGHQSGRSSRNRDIAAWIRKKRKSSIRSDELLAYLCGKSLPQHHRNRQNCSLERQMPKYSAQTDNFEPMDYPVRETLSSQGLSGAMSNINMGFGRASSTTTASSTTISSRSSEEFHFLDDRTRASDHRKRANSSSSMDISMDSPSRKRGRFL